MTVGDGHRDAAAAVNGCSHLLVEHSPVRLCYARVRAGSRCVRTFGLFCASSSPAVAVARCRTDRVSTHRLYLAASERQRHLQALIAIHRKLSMCVRTRLYTEPFRTVSTARSGRPASKLRTCSPAPPHALRYVRLSLKPIVEALGLAEAELPCGL